MWCVVCGVHVVCCACVRNACTVLNVECTVCASIQWPYIIHACTCVHRLSFAVSGVLYEVSHVYASCTCDVCTVRYIHMVLGKGIINNLYMEKYLLYKRGDLII